MSKNRKLMLVSSSKVYGSGLLDHAADFIRDFLNKSKVKKVTFVPFALFDHDAYTDRIREAFKKNKLDFEVIGVHETSSPEGELVKAEAILVGSGNTFLLQESFRHDDLRSILYKRVMQDGIPYIGIGAGTNFISVTLCTTNDMPIVYHYKNLEALNMIPFNVNTHYFDPDPNPKDTRMTREERIKQYQEMKVSYNVVGLREGSVIIVEGDKATLLGKPKARIFIKGKPPQEYPSGSDLSFLLNV